MNNVSMNFKIFIQKTFMHMSTFKQANTQINPYISDSQKINQAKQLSNTITVTLPFICAIVLLAYSPASWQPSPLSMLLGAIFFILSSIGLGIGFHRHFTHHAFKTSTVGKIVLGILGTWTMQGSIISWVADHRRHHRFADQQYDPHSPWANDKGLITNRFAGWWHAHMGWKFTCAESEENRYVPELMKDPVAVFLTRYYWPIAISGYVLPGVLGWFYGGWQEFAACLLWAGCFRAVLLQQFEGIANSITHLFGTKMGDSQNESRNNLWLTVALMGEGLHSYHHQNATVAVNQPMKFDAFGQLIMFFERLGLVWDLRKAKPTPAVTKEQPLQSGLQGAGTI
jgi:stearoyl-CoA desaturase (Delta-9 desaturase)